LLTYKVKFLNQSGGGIVSKVISSNMVHVAIEDGFDIPTMASELIRIEDDDPLAGYYGRSSAATSPKKADSAADMDYYNRITSLVKYPSRPDFQPGLYLALVPHDQKWLLTGLLDIYVINYTDFEILYSYFLKEQDGSWAGIDYDVITERSKCLLETIRREDIEHWAEGVVQFLFHKDRHVSVLEPVSATYRIKPSKFYKEIHYTESSFLSEKAVIIRLSLLTETPIVPPEEKKEADSAPKISQKEISSAPVMPEKLIDKHRIAAYTAEVDLHISALADDYSHLKNHEILNIQTDYFTRCLESAIENHYHKIYFIHGVGNGTLKTRVEEYLKDYNESLEYRDAPYDKYGTGAVEVVIKENL
jgi:hypothetical protein